MDNNKKKPYQYYQYRKRTISSENPSKDLNAKTSINSSINVNNIMTKENEIEQQIRNQYVLLKLGNQECANFAKKFFVKIV